jgi:hypothetical protein
VPDSQNVEYDRFSSREDAPAWHPELFAQGQQARGEGRPLHGPDTPSADAVGDYCRRSWLAGWCDADMALLADADGNQDDNSGPAGMRVGA